MWLVLLIFVVCANTQMQNGEVYTVVKAVKKEDAAPASLDVDRKTGKQFSFDFKPLEGMHHPSPSIGIGLGLGLGLDWDCHRAIKGVPQLLWGILMKLWVAEV